MKLSSPVAGDIAETKSITRHNVTRECDLNMIKPKKIDDIENKRKSLSVVVCQKKSSFKKKEFQNKKLVTKINFLANTFFLHDQDQMDDQ